MSLSDDIWVVASDKAMERGRASRVISAIGSKVRKLKKPGNAVKTGASVAGALIPIPFVSLGTDYIVQKVEGKLRSRARQRNLDTASGPLKKIKHEIKTLDVSKLDRARYKAQHQLIQLNQEMGRTRGVSKCFGAYQMAYRFHRVRYRIFLLRFQAEVLQTLSRKILKWCDEVDGALDTGEAAVKGELRDRLDHSPEECGRLNAKSGCFNAAQNSQKMTQLVSEIGGQVHTPG